MHLDFPAILRYPVLKMRKQERDTMKIDIHAHANYYGLTCEKLLANMDAYGIDKAWLLTLETPRGEYNHNYHRVTWVSEDGPIPFSTSLAFPNQEGRFILGYGPDPRNPDSIDRLEAAIELYNVRVCGELMLRMTYDNLDAIRMFRFCGARGLPVILELMYPAEVPGERCPFPDYWYGGTIDALERALDACPETIFCGHGAGFWGHISKDTRYLSETYPTGPVVPGGKIWEMMEKYPNLYLDLSAGSGLNAMSRDIGYTRDLLLAFQDRALYGRDDIHNKHQAFLNSIELPQNVLDKIYYQNALRLVGE